MLRYISTALCALVLLLAAPAVADTWRDKECRFNDLRSGNTWTTYEVEKTIRCATAKWYVPGGTPKAFSVAQCESGTDLLDHSTDGYAGTYQHAVQYWDARRAALRPQGWELAPSVYNARSNVVVAIRMARSGWSPWPHCGL